MSIRMNKALAIGSVVAGIAVATVGIFWYAGRAEKTPEYQLANVVRGPLSVVVDATGTVEPEEVIDVGAQVVGKIQEFGVDPKTSGRPIDYLSEVEEGTILARIDDSIYRARHERAVALVEQAEAQCDQARINIQRAEADSAQSKATFQKAERDWNRARQLRVTKSISDADHDAAEAAFEVGRADVRIAEAAIEQQRAALRLTQKALAVARADQNEAQRNLEYTVIRSPVKGVIIDRRVNIGQTVVSSLNAPSLFLIAKDLKRLQVWASVNEADVGLVRAGQPVRYTVDAFPGEPFAGQVSQIRLNAAMTQNVVTYTVVIETDNASGKLLPYLTATLQIEIDRRNDALLVPNAALRGQPASERVKPESRVASGTAGVPAGTAGPADAGSTPEQAVVWVPDGAYVRPIPVQIGLSDGVSTEILSGDLKEGMAVIVGDDASGGSDSARPFSPPIFGGGRR